ncbi:MULTISPECIES: hypothetical protein [Acaryochloris]|uniref:hypothetical protein n=1 Tax=Acaryochloris TaxID=155977 RepID=UPI0002484F05|nr:MULTISPECIES: hypothetical protein [Acaryochloris]KAI9129853.1 hypothetical protein ON05_032535 [Acaryochloris sp. CCMEE 5410]BDM83508.1 hypothetical protein AM10699_63690 [Acaryochloris marina MBIC10699]
MTTTTLPTLPPVPAPHPENAWCQLSIDQAIAFARAGQLDPAILIWGFSPQVLSVIPPDLLAAANESLPGLMDVLEGAEQ